jgi:glutamyl-tRNA reductase
MSHKMLHGALAELHAGDPQARDRARHAIEHFFLRGNR